MTRLVVVGCGPKAVSIAAKAHVLQRLGWQVPEITIVDKHGPLANWDGRNGYTDGAVRLGTPPLEDVGFPYKSLLDRSVDMAMLPFSYAAHLIATDQYAEWVNRGLRPPTHGMLADYFRWVLRQTAARVITGFVTAASCHRGRWSLAYRDDAGSAAIEGDGLVLTGPGDPYRFPRAETRPNERLILNGQTVWRHIHLFQGLRNARIAVIGAGETAAAVVAELLSRVDDSTHIEIISRHPILFTRNENWFEVMYFSTAMDWTELPDQAKADIIRHADRGTFSAATKDLLDSVHNVTLRLGSAKMLSADGTKVSVVLAGPDQSSSQPYDYVIEATGFDPYSLVDLVADQAFVGDRGTLPARLDQNLCVEGAAPRLHLPGLSAHAQGPGFPNLSCLGLLAERVLMPYIAR